MEKVTSYVFIDASNLFYGGEKSLGMKVRNLAMRSSFFLIGIYRE